MEQAVFGLGEEGCRRRETPDLPQWVSGLVDVEGAPWREAGAGLSVRAVVNDRFTLASVACREAVRLDEATFHRCTAEAYRLLADELEGGCTGHLVRVWNFIPEILAPLGSLPQRYMVFNAGRFSAYEDWYRGRESFDRQVATASGVGHLGSDFLIHGLASAAAGIPVENPRQTPSYRYSSRYGPLPPCFARATRVRVDPARSPWLLVGGTASVRGEETVFPGDLEAQAEETLCNLAAVVAAGLGIPAPNDHGSGADLLARYRHLRVYYVHAEHEQEVARLIERPFADAEVELVRADLCRGDLLIEIEGVAELTPRLAPAG